MRPAGPSTPAPECGLMLVTVTANRLSDAQLVRRCRGGDPEAWTQLVERFSRYVYAIAVQGYRLREHDAEDAFQEVFARVYDRLDSLRNDAAVRPWIAQLARRVCLDRLSTEAREKPTEAIEPPGVSDTLAELDEAFTLHDALARLPEQCREVLDRFFTKDESYRTIGDALQLPAGTIASRISRCLKKLRDELEGRNPPAQTSGE